MNQYKKHLVYFVLFLIAFITACKKEGEGGKSTIKGLVLHHSKPVPLSTVYIKYGATEFPGLQPSDYDASVNANAAAEYEIKNLRKGNYYLFSIGYDSAIVAPVRGGIPTEIRDKKGEQKIDIAVTE